MTTFKANNRMDDMNLCGFCLPWLKRHKIKLMLFACALMTAYGLFSTSGDALASLDLDWKIKIFNAVTPVPDRLSKHEITFEGLIITRLSPNGEQGTTSTRKNQATTTPKSKPIESSTKSTSKSESTTKKSKSIIDRNGPINPHPFNFTVLPIDFCNDSTLNSSSPFLLIVVHTHPHHYPKRQGIRETWGSRNRSKTEIFGSDCGIETKVLFTMGWVPNDSPSNLERLRNESDTYEDILQEDFVDAYKNLSYKAVMWMKFVALYCPRAFYVLKVDDDVFVNRYTVFKLARQFYENPSASRSAITCRMYVNSPIVRGVGSRWYVSEEEFPGTVYMPYCYGPGYFFSAYLTKLLYNVSFDTKFLWVDDVFATGVLPMALDDDVNVTYYHLGAKMIFFGHDLTSHKNLYEQAMFVHMGFFGQGNLHYWWNLFLDSGGLLPSTATTTTTQRTTPITKKPKQAKKIIYVDDAIVQMQKNYTAKP